ncbi:MAG TPA: farnesyltranstransferase [Rhodospirillaceae bacterium]|nr:farnesyltranstransferase [Rhodospirillaceae bacterium]
MGAVLSLHKITSPPQCDPLEALSALVADDLAAVNRLILERMDSDVPLISDLAQHVISAGGKRLRPLLALAVARLCDYEGTRHQKLATSVEFIHTATLLHDDVVDASLLRRGSSSANALFGNQASVLVGDFLFSRAFHLMVEDGSLEVLRILSNASAVISQGEVLQLVTQRDTATSEQAYLDIISAKTAELFASACRVGAVVANKTAAEDDALRTFGLNLGIAFQIVDDVLDYSAVQEKLGKTIGDDFREGKITLPVILAINRGDESERHFWQRVIGGGDKQDGDFVRAQEIMRRRGALRDAMERARHYGAIARDSLGIFDSNPYKAALLDIVDFTIERKF